MEIPLVDISSSQEEDLEQLNMRKRKETVTIVGSSPKRSRSDEATPTRALESLNARLDALESVVKSTLEAKNAKDKYVTREEFDACLERIARFEGRLQRMEQLIENLKSVFLGTGGQSKQKAPMENSARLSSNTFGKASTIHQNGNASVTSASGQAGADAGSSGSSSTPTSRLQSTNAGHTATAQTPYRRTSTNSNAGGQGTGVSSTSNRDTGADHPVMHPPGNAGGSAGGSTTPSGSTSKAVPRTELSPGNESVTNQATFNAQSLNLSELTIQAVTPKAPARSSDHGVRSTLPSKTPRKSLPMDHGSGRSERHQPPQTANSRATILSGPAREHQVPISKAHSRPGPSSTRERDVSNSAGLLPTPRSVVPNTLQGAGPSSKSGQTSRAGHSKTPSSSTTSLPVDLRLESTFSGPSSISIGEVELTDEMISRIRVKREVYDEPLQRTETPLSFRKIADRFLVYVDGDSRKMRGHHIVAAVSGFSLSDSLNQVLPYLSDLKLPGREEDRKYINKLREAVRKQTEVMAAYYAILYIKLNSREQGPKKIEIVSRCLKLPSIMNDLHNVYSSYLTCDCVTFPCGHNGRWETLDSFAALLSDDLPRLVLATRDVDVVWRNYAPQENAIGELLKTEFKNELSKLLQQHRRK